MKACDICGKPLDRNNVTPDKFGIGINGLNEEIIIDIIVARLEDSEGFGHGKPEVHLKCLYNAIAEAFKKLSSK